ncbi:MAG: CCA tRNA nucleotidyltransferase [Candidatus Omnitrophica bacterium]|nr:CCA tRNA nucleotidyltransferase [Candidatus Omnitrophota bacterium]
MKKYLERLPGETEGIIHAVKQICARQGMSAYLVGGFVRDLLLGVKNLDLDIAVEGDGIKFAENLAELTRGKIIRHKRFGTATIITPGGSSVFAGRKIDIASARSESYPQAAHLPVTRPGSLKDDLYRRDFTINAMAISLSPGSSCELLDFFGGQADLKKKNIRVLHRLSFIDDPTRILRAVRFEQRFAFKIEPETLEYLKEAVKMKMLEKVQPQRTRDDLILVLKEDKPIREIKRLQELANFSFLSPRLSLAKKEFLLLNSIEKEINWFKKNFTRRRPLDTWLLYLMGLLDSLGAGQIRSICKKFAFRKGDQKRILGVREEAHALIKELSKNKVKPSRIYGLLEPLSYEAVIMLKAKYKDRLVQKRIADFFEVYNGMQISVSGKDLQKLGASPGPQYRKIFTAVLDARLNGAVKTRGDEMRLIKRLLG